MMIKYKLIYSIFIFATNFCLSSNVYSEADSACQKVFIDKLLRSPNAFFIIKYLDSTDSMHLYLLPEGRLNTQIKININISYSEMYKIFEQKLLKNEPLTFHEFGRLYGIELIKTNFYTKWMRKGKKKFLRKFTKNSIVKSQYQWLRIPEMYLVAYNLGIITGDAEEQEAVFYISECKINEI